MRKSLFKSVGARAGVASLAGNAASAVIGVFGIRVLTEIAPPAVFGEANLALNILVLALAVFVTPFTNTQLRYHSKAVVNNGSRTFSQAALSWSVAGALVGAMALIVATEIWKLFGGPSLSILLLAAGSVWIVASAIRQALLSRLQAESRISLYASITVLEALLLIGLSASLLLLSKSAEAYLWGQALALVTAAALGYLLAPFASSIQEPRREFLRHDFGLLAWKYGAPFVPIAVFGWLANLSDRYVLAHELGTAAAGAYLAQSAIASRGMMLVNAAVTDVMRPRLFDAVNAGDDGKAQTVLRQWLAVRFVVSGIALLGLIILGWLMVLLLLAPEYRAHAETIMIWIGIAFAILGFAQILETRLFSLDLASWLLPAMICGAATNLICSFLFIPAAGGVGAAQALCAGYSVQFIATAFALILARRLRSKGAPPANP